jgi:hypothetical protein
MSATNNNGAVMTTLYENVAAKLAHRNVITIACGTTCAYLGDERNLREFLVADETARHLHRAGHTVISLLIDDSMDPLTFPQLRVAVNKDPVLIERYQHWCGKPIARLPDPWGCCASFADHFEQQLLDRLHHLDCHPTLVRTATLYERGVYAPYVYQVLERSDEIMRFLGERFKQYQPQKLFWVLCPKCGYIDETHIMKVANRTVTCHCARCDQTTVIGFDELQGKLNWKLDCAVRWAILKIDAEAFSKAYLEPQTGTFSIAQALSQEFFGGHPVVPLHYGLVQMEKKLSLTLLDALPPHPLRSMLVEHPAADITLSRDLVVTVASRYEVLPDMTYLDFVKQVLPVWLLTPTTLRSEQRALVAHGVAFKKHFLNEEVRLTLPHRAMIEGTPTDVAHALHTLLCQAIELREHADIGMEQFQERVHGVIARLGQRKSPVLRRLRLIVGQQQGLPASRLLFLLPIEYVQMLAYMLHLYINSDALEPEEAVLV